MASVNAGKDFVCGWIRQNFPKDSTILDVGACDGKWRTLLPEYKIMDAVEVWEPNVRAIGGMYRLVYYYDIREFPFEGHRYDLMIFGDVIEHLPVADAQEVLRNASEWCRDMIVSVPWLWPQGPYNGNPYEEHIQDDLTPEIFAQRYPGFEVLHDPGNRICYYHKKQKTEE